MWKVLLVKIAMKVFKFGGASVKDAQSIKNVGEVLRREGFESCLLVVSAMGKTTNALEKVCLEFIETARIGESLEPVVEYHKAIIEELFEPSHSLFSELELIFDQLRGFTLEEDKGGYDYYYDQIVSFGELISSKILSAYLLELGFLHEWLDARNYILTDSTYREGEVNWEDTLMRIKEISPEGSYVTQGFIGSDIEKQTVTLGREGSDYSAAIFAYGLDADSMTIWKDVPGVMSGDPRKFHKVTLLEEISFEEAIEMAYYGASVIHPKTMQPLQRKNIPFFVKSFLEPDKKGTKISSAEHLNKVESYILKENQYLLTLSTKDFSFIAEEHLSEIFRLLSAFQIKISLMQNTAISLELCLEDKYNTIDNLLTSLEPEFSIHLQEGLSLLTVRNTDGRESKRFTEGKTVYLEQTSNEVLQFVFRPDLDLPIIP